ncbi:hypothetical protein P8452_33044 [Trifolium repens]|nr:hypothetical protein P8452_33044 [Trifolium repens]
MSYYLLRSEYQNTKLFLPGKNNRRRKVEQQNEEETRGLFNIDGRTKLGSELGMNMVSRSISQTTCLVLWPTV